MAGSFKPRRYKSTYNGLLTYFIFPIKIIYLPEYNHKLSLSLSCASLSFGFYNV